MADGTKIEWTDATWNIINGCSVTSPGCTNCYAMRLAGTRLRDHPSRKGLTRESKAGPVWTGETRFNEKVLLDPLRWRRPRRIFVCAHGDLFHESVPDEWIDLIFAVMALAPQHQFQVLTKRAERMRQYLAGQDRPSTVWNAVSDLLEQWDEGKLGGLRLPVFDGDPMLPALAAHGALWGGDRPWPLVNAWAGVSVEDQDRADERIPHLLATPAVVRWLSCEPLLGPVDLSKIAVQHDLLPDSATRDDAWAINSLTGRLAPIMHTAPDDWDLDGGGQAFCRLNWIVAGGESGPGARPMHPDWARSLRDQCAAAGVAFLFKQWGAWLPGENDGSQPLASWQDGQLGRHGSSVDERKSPEWRHFGTPGSPGAFALRIGKKRAGRLLDGVEHNGYPA